MLIPLALAQFICSFAGSSMNVMITDIGTDLHTTVAGVQLAITVFLLVMAALMIPGGALTERWGRKRCFQLGLLIYAAGALLSAVAPGLGVLILGNSILEGVGTALLIPPVYILTTLLFTDTAARAGAFGLITGMGGVGAATGPLIGGVISTTISWRAVFLFQVLIIVVIMALGRRISDPLPAVPDRPFDLVGTVLSASGMVFLVLGIMQANNGFSVMMLQIAVGVLVLAAFVLHLRSRERLGRPVLLSLSMFGNRTSNLGLITQNIQWLLLMGSSFVVATYLQVVRGFNAVETGVICTAATIGILCSSLLAARSARNHPARVMIIAGFLVTIAGMVVLLVLVRAWHSAWAFTPGLLLTGLGLGAMLTPSVNVVQSAFPEDQQGEISGLSRAVSNLGSALGTSIAGTLLLVSLATPGRAYLLAVAVLVAFAVAGLVAAWFLPVTQPEPVENSG
ncbi:MFS transporter [Nocardia huaxiensis]|uniref:MFS transporter n=1 Tax=Nocardia huaxiensis TaxID=2755382 RepID=A0A7D6ZFL2_9NOCA|nr:MFS transporter [Nocardia huaxiensis]QLY34368.1 MFS transporter [Nocardia huaxiensis]UFT00046.1 MFS transporter [Nocardia huaxiensis]